MHSYKFRLRLRNVTEQPHRTGLFMGPSRRRFWGLAYGSTVSHLESKADPHPMRLSCKKCDFRKSCDTTGLELFNKHPHNPVFVEKVGLCQSELRQSLSPRVLRKSCVRCLLKRFIDQNSWCNSFWPVPTFSTPHPPNRGGCVEKVVRRPTFEFAGRRSSHAGLLVF